MLISWSCTTSIACPGISTDIYGYPIAAAAAIAVDTVLAWLLEHDGVVRLVFFTWNPESTRAIETALADRAQRPPFRSGC